MAKGPSKKELGRFADTYKAASREQQQICLQLILNAVFMEEQLTQLQAKIRENGVKSEYQNGENQWGEKKSVEVDVYNAMIKNYAAVIRQLGDMLPQAPPADDDLVQFLKSRGGGGPLTDLERYCTGILDGKIVACRRMKQVAERLLEDLASPGGVPFWTRISLPGTSTSSSSSARCRLAPGDAPEAGAVPAGPPGGGFWDLWTTATCAATTRC